MSGQTESQWKLKWALGQWEDKSSHISTTKVSFSIWVSAWQQSRCVVGIFVGGQSLIVQKKKAVCEEVNQKGEGNEKEDAGKDKRARRTKLQAGVALGMLEQEKKDSKSEE